MYDLSTHKGRAGTGYDKSYEKCRDGASEDVVKGLSPVRELCQLGYERAVFE